ncbi:glycoside hydrolase family 43 protein [Rathayibacter soli]|uniref:glycoside hydrolase family 43 protein n=1 Tax=Rathayibacter soli TaxID=3144168 RepID=UPI0027E4B01D|nr:glycoside hydrolase family 43 protein [Glaciibacter superstes]
MHETFSSFLLAYFHNGSASEAEQIRFAVSDGPSPDRWTVLNGARPILASNVGEHGVRDPFILWDASSGRYIVIATDLRTNPDDDWNRAVRSGSRSIAAWESVDLVHWSEPRLVAVAPENAGNAWAPKAFWSDVERSWKVFFASALYDAGDDRTVARHQRMLVADTKDFSEFTTAEVYLDPGHDVIDATFLHWGDHVLRFTADSLTADPAAKSQFVSQEMGTDILSTDFRIVARDVGAAHQSRAEGPTPFMSLDGRIAYLLLDEFGLRGYRLYRSTSPQTASWEPVPSAVLPSGSRHGSVIPITASQRGALLSSYPSESRARCMPHE